MNASDRYHLSNLVYLSDPRPIDVKEIAEKMYRHLSTVDIVDKDEYHERYLIDYFRSRLVQAVNEDREARMLFNAMQP